MSDPSTAGKSNRWLKKAVTRMTSLEDKKFKDLTGLEVETLHRIRQTLALDALGYRNAEIEQILHLKKDTIYALRGTYPVLWGLDRKSVV